MNDADTKTCPDCAEEIKAQARVCRYCGYRFEDESEPDAVDEVSALEPKPPPEPDTPAIVAEAPLRSRRRWPRDLGYAAAIVLWILAAIPLAGQLADPPRDGTEIASAVAVAVGVSLLLAGAIRLAYVALRKRRFMSPSLFLLAALVAVVTYSGQVRQEEERVDREAVDRGVAESADDVTPVERCVTKALEGVDTLSPEQRALIPTDARSFLSRVCATAEREGTASGDVYATDEFKLAACTERVLVEFDRIPRAERAFTRADFAIFGERYCEEAFSRGFGVGTSQREIEALQDEVLAHLVDTGQIKRIR